MSKGSAPHRLKEEDAQQVIFNEGCGGKGRLELVNVKVPLLIIPGEGPYQSHRLQTVKSVGNLFCPRVHLSDKDRLQAPVSQGWPFQQLTMQGIEQAKGGRPHHRLIKTGQDRGIKVYKVAGRRHEEGCLWCKLVLLLSHPHSS